MVCKSLVDMEEGKGKDGFDLFVMERRKETAVGWITPLGLGSHTQW